LRRAGLFRQTIIDFRFVTLIFFVSITAMVCVYTRVASKEYNEETAQSAQRRTGRQQTRRRAPTARASRVDYSKFSHATKGHFENCASCHQIKSFAQPDIRDYPDHPSCTNCHRQQFFRGARPVICSNCHTVTSPRAEARLKFPKEEPASQFADIFPHANHVKTTSLLQFKNVIGEKANIQATCNYCHKVDKTAFKPRPGAAKDTFLPPAGTFMTTPTSHVTCFQCHWQKGVENKQQPPLATECSGCHQNLSRPLLQTAALQLSPAAAAATPAGAANVPKIIPALARATMAQNVTSAHNNDPWPHRVSPKFVHEIDAHKKRANEEGKEVAISCLQCHVSVRKVTSLEVLRQKSNQVQLPTCSSSACHTAVSGSAQLKLSVFRELRERGKDAKFDCALCHAPPVSLNPEVPCSHYKTVYESAVKEKKGTKGIEGLTPQRCADGIKKEGQ